MSANNEAIVAESFELVDSEPLVEADPIFEEPVKEEKKTEVLPEKPGSGLITTQVVSWFSACARCSFFFVGYRLEQGVEEVRSAVHDSENGWLSLKWSQTMCKHVRKSYGYRFDMDCHHFTGACPDCQRQFVYSTAGDDEDSRRFRIELKPGAGK